MSQHDKLADLYLAYTVYLIDIFPAILTWLINHWGKISVHHFCELHLKHHLLWDIYILSFKDQFVFRGCFIINSNEKNLVRNTVQLSQLQWMTYWPIAKLIHTHYPLMTECQGTSSHTHSRGGHTVSRRVSFNRRHFGMPSPPSTINSKHPSPWLLIDASISQLLCYIMQCCPANANLPQSKMTYHK